MRYFDVFNGDADGMCALHQLRLVKPLDSSLITGVKHDVNLLSRVPVETGIRVTVLDISLEVNRSALLALLQLGTVVEYFDHHYCKTILVHSNLKTHIDTTPHTCTSLLVDRHLDGQHRRWAIVGAFGDNLQQASEVLAQSIGLQPEQIDQLRQLGESINYNAYGDTISDLLISPNTLYELLRPYPNPFEFLANASIVEDLHDARRRDMELAKRVLPKVKLLCGEIYVLPNDPWARRVRGTFGNFLSARDPGHSHAVLSEKQDGGFAVSVRASIANPFGAAKLCTRFATGGGREAAAGINRLAKDSFLKFVDEFQKQFDG